MKKITSSATFLLVGLTLGLAQQNQSIDIEQQEIDANNNYLTTLSAEHFAKQASFDNTVSKAILADLVPIAGQMETFTPVAGDLFFDPGGPGGSTSDGAPGNYPNCNCITTSTLQGITELTFDTFNVFGNFDWVRVIDGSDNTGTVLYDNGPNGTNDGDITLNDMLASAGTTTFTGTSGDMTIEFRASIIVNQEGFQISFPSEGGCEAAENFMVSNVLDTTADMTWDEAPTANDGYQTAVYLQGADPIVDVPIYVSDILAQTTTSDTATGLSAEIAYDAYLFTICDLSATPPLFELSGPITFNTILNTTVFETDTLAMYPNPTNGMVTLRANVSIETLEVYNILGQVVINRAPNVSEITLDVSSLQSGTYFVKATAEGVTTTQKLIKR